MKRVVLVNQCSGYLMVDIVNAYAQKYNKVSFITGGVVELERHLDSSVKINKIVAYNKKSTVSRIVTWVISFIQIFFLLLFKYRKCHVVYVTNPPMSYFASLILKMSFSIIVFDAYPDALRNIGIKQGNWIYDLWTKWNRILFKKANCVYTLSDGMAEQLSCYVDKKKIKVVPLWTASSSLSPIDKKNNHFVLEHGLEDKFVVLYSGNMGYTHSIEVLVEVAEKLKENQSIQFLFIGNGNKKTILEESVREKGLKNCMFLGWQDREIVPYSLASADLGVVTINEETALTSVPSKTFNLMAVGSPLLCIAPEKSEIAQIISKYNNGKVFSTDKINEISIFIESLLENKENLKMMSKNSLEAAKNYTEKNAFDFVD